MTPLFPLAGLGLLLLLGGKKRPEPGTRENGHNANVAPSLAETLDEAAAEPTGDPRLDSAASGSSGPLLDDAAAGAPVVLPVAETPEEMALVAAATDAADRRDWETAVASALAAGDASTLEAIASAMAADGLTDEAATVDQAVAQLRTDSAIATTELRAELAERGELPEGVPVVVTVAEVQAAEPAPPVPAEDPRLSVAKDLAAYLETTSRYREDRQAVAEWQADLGLVADGMYGPRTALELASFGIIPPDPFYWPSSGTTQAVAEYKAALLDHADADPARAAQWRAAAERAGR